MVCPLCRQADETAHHLFLVCHFSRLLWREGPWAFNLAAFSQESLIIWFKFILNPYNLPANVRGKWDEFMLYIAIVLDSLWFTRNKVVHENLEPNASVMVQEVARRYADHGAAWSQKKCCIFWQPPLVGQLKINYDVSIKEDIMCFVAVCKNHIGGLREAQGYCRKGNDPLQGEACAALLACQITDNQGDVEIVIEGDSLVVWQEVTDRSASPHWLIEGEIATIRHMLDNDPN